MHDLDFYWTIDPGELTRALESSATGLESREAALRLSRYGPNLLESRRSVGRVRLFLAQLRNPLLALLVFAASVSMLTGEWVDAGIVVAIIVATAGIGAAREYQARLAADALKSRVQVHATVLRDGQPSRIPVADVVPGDVVELAAGGIVPADAVLLAATDCHVDEAALTGESFPAAKRVGPAPPTTPLAGRTGCVHLGTSVRSGTARALVVRTGRSTAYGAIAHSLAGRAPETEFDRGLRRFGYLLTSTMTAMTLLVLAANVLLGRPPVETLLFSIALAVGLSPELLPAILAINLARGATAMAAHGVLVRRLPAIENLGSMDVLCTDKTGTLTEGVVRMDGAWRPDHSRSGRVLGLAAANAALQTGISSPLDLAILDACRPDVGTADKLGEVPYDFARRRVSVVVRRGAGRELVTKGAAAAVLAACTRDHEGRRLDAAALGPAQTAVEAWAGSGLRVLAVATRALDAGEAIGRDCEHDLALEGFVTFQDRPRPGVRAALDALAGLGVSVRLITGDAGAVARHVAAEVGLGSGRTLTGAHLDELDDRALARAVEETDLFVEVDPNQKERIIRALRGNGHVVGFLGDGINDAPAMHAADTGLSVEGAVDVAREAADFVLMGRDLDVIRRGIVEGRRTFANTLKYVRTTTSANLGNMVSMAAVSLVLPFLPLLAGQVLLNNFLSDVPAVGIADDDVDPELVAEPHRWDMPSLARFMLLFGLGSSAFDFLTFWVLVRAHEGAAAPFRTGWFVESLLTELAVALVVRTRRPFWRSRPGSLLAWTTAAVAVLAIAIPWLPGAALVGFVPLPATTMLALLAIVLLYVASTELIKRAGGVRLLA
ncbi:MAG: magnesium-translocating P-type ATPase [Steroidobacteraceae bacterium]